MKRTLVFLVCCVMVSSGLAQKRKSDNDIYHAYFEETAKATKAYSYLWDKDLYAPMLLVDLENGLLYANEPDDFGVLQQEGKIYVGKLPDDLMVANTASEWNGKTWAMVQLPLPKDYSARINLLTHELFHVAQPGLGFTGFNPENVHLDEKDGRIYLRLELEALKRAVQESSDVAMKEHLTNAVIFRKYRNTLYEGSEESENQLELNEGLAEYTGMMHAGRDEKQAKKHFTESIDDFCRHSPTFIRSFAYKTIPVYGYLLQKNQKDWNQKVDITTNLIDYFTAAFDIKLPDDLGMAAEKILPLYDGKNIIDAETTRDENTKKIKAVYREKFVELPHLELYREQMSIGFNITNIFSLDEAGTVYPTMKVQDNWGVLDVENGALMSPMWNKITVALPFEKEGNNIMGDGWTLELNDNYELIKDEATGNYSVKLRYK